MWIAEKSSESKERKEMGAEKIKFSFQSRKGHGQGRPKQTKLQIMTWPRAEAKEMDT